MNLYLISQNFNRGYDTYDSAVVIAEDEDTARKMSPSNGDEYTHTAYSPWAPSELVNVELLGAAKDGSNRGVVCASFNAG